MDIRTICIVISTTMSICTFIGGTVAFCILKFNDAHHAEKNFKEFKVSVENSFSLLSGKIDDVLKLGNSNTQEIAVINERCKSHKIVQNKRKK